MKLGQLTNHFIVRNPLADFLDDKPSNEVLTDKDGFKHLKILDEGIYDLRELFNADKDDELILTSQCINTSCELIFSDGRPTVKTSTHYGYLFPDHAKLKYSYFNNRKIPLLFKGHVFKKGEYPTKKGGIFSPPDTYTEEPFKTCCKEDHWSNDNYLVINNNSDKTIILLNESNNYLNGVKGYITDYHPLAERIAKANKCNVVSIRYHINYFDHSLGITGHRPTTNSIYEDADFSMHIIKEKLPKTKKINVIGYCLGSTSALSLGFLLGEDVHIWDTFINNRHNHNRAKWHFMPKEHDSINFSLSKYYKGNSKFHYYINNTETLNDWYFGFDGCDFVDKSYLHIIHEDRNKMVTVIDNVAHGKVKLFYDYE
tara:strand:- start:338 stop:1450 length:1113 start_codon:yes stop_codon:yes gene_type:complete